MEIELKEPRKSADMELVGETYVALRHETSTVQLRLLQM